jgi:hypothetical protein
LSVPPIRVNTYKYPAYPSRAWHAVNGSVNFLGRGGRGRPQFCQLSGRVDGARGLAGGPISSGSGSGSDSVKVTERPFFSETPYNFRYHSSRLETGSPLTRRASRRGTYTSAHNCTALLFPSLIGKLLITGSVSSKKVDVINLSGSFLVSDSVTHRPNMCGCSFSGFRKFCENLEPQFAFQQ